MTTRATSSLYDSFWRCRRCPEEGPVRPPLIPAPLFASVQDLQVCLRAIGAPLPPLRAPRPARQGHIERQTAPNQSP